MNIYCDTLSAVKEALSFGFKPIILGERMKEPIEKGYTQKYSSISEKDLIKEASRRKGSNVGILLTNVFCIDVDIQKSGSQNWLKLLEDNNIEHPDDIDTPIVRSGSLGRHYYFQLTSELKNTNSYLSDNDNKIGGIDVKHSGYLVYPGSVYGGCSRDKPHKCGVLDPKNCLFQNKLYEWIKSPKDVNIAPVPEWLYKYIKFKSVSNSRKKPTRIINSSTELIRKCFPHLKSRADTYHEWRDMIWCIRSLGYSDEVSVELSHEFSSLSKAYDPDSVDKIWSDYDPERSNWGWHVITKWLKEDIPKPEYENFYKTHFSSSITEDISLDLDWGLSHTFVGKVRDTLKLIDSRGNGYMYNEKTRLWNKIYPEFLCNIVSTTLRPMMKEMEKSNPDLYGPVLTRVLKTSGASAIARQASKELFDKNFFLSLNRSPDFLPIKDGKLLNLTTLEVRDRVETDYFTFECPVEYKPSDEYKVAEEFFHGICAGDREYMEYMRSLLAYFLTGYTSDRKFYIFVGSGMNGKSTLIRLMHHILGDFYTSLSETVVISQDRSSNCTPELVPLVQARLGVLPENKENVSLNSERLKAFTGDDPIMCRPLYMEQFSFITQSKLILMTNHLPRFNSADKGMVDRLVVLPFYSTFTHNPYYKDFLFQHIDEIFSYIVSAKGCVSNLPKVVTTEIQKYVRHNDLVSLFIEDCCEIREKGVERASDIYSEYKKWCEENNNPLYVSNKFFSILEQRFPKKRTKAGMSYIGLRLGKDLEEEKE